MRNYLVFRGLNYYPKGGMDDFYRSFDSLHLAIQYYNKYTMNESKWAHVYSLKDKKIVHEVYR